MIRYLDFNDTYPGGHPSDALGPVIALADTLGSAGADLIAAVAVGYDIFIKLAMTAKLRERGWDQGFGVGLATTAAASMLLGLDQERTRHALSISAVSNVPLRATRAGQLSLWKGVATSYAAANALFGTLLAAKGMTGPEAPITGRHGLQELVSGEFEAPAVRAAQLRHPAGPHQVLAGRVPSPGRGLGGHRVPPALRARDAGVRGHLDVLVGLA